MRLLPGVEAAALSDRLPAAGNRTVSFQVEGRVYSCERDCSKAREGVVTPGHFKAFEAPVLQGREFSELDQPGTLPVAVVNESFVRAFLPNGDVLGRRIRKVRSDAQSPWLVIVGIVPDMHMEGLGNTNRSPAGFYLPLAQSDGADSVSLAWRTRVEPMRVADEVRAAVASLNRDLPIFSVMSMKEVIRRESWLIGVFGTFFPTLGFAALILGLASLYAIMSFTVTQRSREMSIRAALGAQSGQLVRLVVMREIVQLGAGMALGLALGLVTVIPMQFVLYGVNPRDPVLIATVLAGLTISGLLANLIPASRITKIEAAAALTVE